jgi:hypothetical protein
MARPLSNLDYLITYQPAASAPAGMSAPPASAKAAADRAIDEASVALGGPILTALYKAPEGKQTAFELVDALNVRLEDLFAVLDILSSRFQWIEVDKTDPKGNYQVVLTERGRDYAEKTMGLRAS